MTKPLEYLGRQWARFKLRWGRRWEPVALREALLAAECLLVCLPERDVPQAREIVVLMEALGIRRTTVLCAHPAKIQGFGPEVGALSLEDVGWFHLPRRALKDRIIHGGYDVAIDLNRDFSIASAYLCALSGAKLRVGLGATDDGTFFNLHYQGGSTTLGDTCQSLARLFREMRGG
ncbi:MAG: hypothetical protein V1800_16475 [Candidatus Latescibacterota bacterium]